MWIYIILIIFLDGLIVYFFPGYFNQINFLYPMLTVSLIIFLFFTENILFYLFYCLFYL